MRPPAAWRQQLFDVAAFFQRDVGGAFDEVLELIVAGDEVGFGIDFDQRAGIAADGNADQAFGGDAAGFLRGLGKAFLAQPVDRGFHVAAGFGQRVLAIHHARAGLVAQVLHQLAVIFAILVSVSRENPCGRSAAASGSAGFRRRGEVSCELFRSRRRRRPLRPGFPTGRR